MYIVLSYITELMSKYGGELRMIDILALLHLILDPDSISQEVTQCLPS